MFRFILFLYGRLQQNHVIVSFTVIEVSAKRLSELPVSEDMFHISTKENTQESYNELSFDVGRRWIQISDII